MKHAFLHNYWINILSHNTYAYKCNIFKIFTNYDFFMCYLSHNLVQN